jgi:hypothetical protein
MRKKVLRSNERNILSESLIGKSFEDAKKISGFNGFSLKILNEEINLNKQYDTIYVVVEDNIIKIIK